MIKKWATAELKKINIYLNKIIMKIKKIISSMFASFLLIGLCTISSNILAQAKKDTVKMKDCCMMKNGKMLCKMGVKTMPMNKDMTMKNGTKCMPNGECLMKDGKKIKLKEGECMNMNGEIETCESKMKQVDKTSKTSTPVIIDPVCGMKTDQSESFDWTYEGKKYSFDSYECKEAFKMNPTKYLENKCTSTGSNIDLVCGIKTDLTESFDYKYDGKIYYFHSYDCREAFKMNPKKYIDNKCVKKDSIK